MTYVRIAAIASLVLAFMPALALAVETEATTSDQRRNPETQSGRPAKWYDRFQPHELNYAVWRAAKGDDQAAEAQYSFKYKILDHHEDNFHQLDIYLSYTGKFDFYMGTRDSSPVVNRTSNPAVHVRQYFQKDTKWVDLSVEHKSDGQVTDAKKKDTTLGSPTFGQYITQIEATKGNHHYFDSISRGTNYLAVTPGMEYTGGFLPKKEKQSGNVALEAKLWRFANESEITWGKYAGTDRDFNDYDIFRVKAFHNYQLGGIFESATAGAEYLIGEKGFATDSIDLYFILRLHWCDTTLPLLLKSHFGPMERLSDYTRSISTIGGGLALSF